MTLFRYFTWVEVAKSCIKNVTLVNVLNIRRSVRATLREEKEKRNEKNVFSCQVKSSQVKIKLQE